MASDVEYCDSDIIDSDVEAELYASIHHSSDVSMLEKTSFTENYCERIKTEDINVSNIDEDLFVIDTVLNNSLQSTNNNHLDQSFSVTSNDLISPSNPFNISLLKNNPSRNLKTFSSKQNTIKPSKKFTKVSNSHSMSDSSTSSSDEDFSCSKTSKTRLNLKSASQISTQKHPSKKFNISNLHQVSDSSTSTSDEELENCDKVFQNQKTRKIKRNESKYHKLSKSLNTSNGSGRSTSSSDEEFFSKQVEKVNDSDSSSDVEILSDYKSVIATSPEICEKNIDTVILSSSDSESQLSDSEPSNCNISLNVSGSQELVEWSVVDNRKELWKINDEDLYPFFNKGRYHSRKDLVCHSCQGKGHTSKFCNARSNNRCYICGGSHYANNCKEKLCLNCFELGHLSCSLTRRTMCSICLMLGHHESVCPDIWRRYHLTTENAHFKNGTDRPQKVPLYCSNCGAKGHYNAQCSFSVMDPRFFPTKPVVHWTKNSETTGHIYPWRVASLKKQLRKQKLKAHNAAEASSSPNMENSLRKPKRRRMENISPSKSNRGTGFQENKPKNHKKTKNANSVGKNRTSDFTSETVGHVFQFKHAKPQLVLKRRILRKQQKIEKRLERKQARKRFYASFSGPFN